MRLATLRTDLSTAAVRLDGEHAVEIPGASDVGTLLTDPDWQERARSAAGESHPTRAARWAPVVTHPGKIVCVGLNYRSHILEMGRELPENPTLFAKYAEALIGADDDIEIPPSTDAVDWEGELVVVIGRSVRGVDERAAQAAIAGFSVMNDVTMRDYQYRTKEWLQGKTFENTTPVGPVLVTADEWRVGPELRTEVDGEVVQRASTSDLVFGPAALVAYISQIVTLKPGDIIATGTPGGVGHARIPARYLRPGNRVVTTIDGIGSLHNTCVEVDARGDRVRSA